MPIRSARQRHRRAPATSTAPIRRSCKGRSLGLLPLAVMSSARRPRPRGTSRPSLTVRERFWRMVALRRPATSRVREAQRQAIWRPSPILRAKVIADGGAPATGTVTNVGTNNGLTGGPITGTGTIGRALNEATISATAAATSTFTNTSFAMSGLGATYTLTPVYSSRVHFTIYGNTSNATANDNVQLIFNYGSGTAPGFGAGVVGTQVGTTVTGTSSTANARVPFSITGIITGLSHGTAYWFDLQNAVNAGTGTIQVTGFAAFEFLIRQIRGGSACDQSSPRSFFVCSPRRRNAAIASCYGNERRTVPHRARPSL